MTINNSDINDFLEQIKKKKSRIRSLFKSREKINNEINELITNTFNSLIGEFAVFNHEIIIITGFEGYSGYHTSDKVEITMNYKTFSERYNDDDELNRLCVFKNQYQKFEVVDDFDIFDHIKIITRQDAVERMKRSINYLVETFCDDMQFFDDVKVTHGRTQIINK